jgi:hypothetical protein
MNMNMKMFVVLSIVSILSSIGLISINAGAAIKTNSDSISSNLELIQILPTTISAIKASEIKPPDWLQVQYDAEQAAARAASRRLSYSGLVYTYSVETRGVITSSLSEFKFLANQTLNDPRGWARMGISFQEVAYGGNFTLVLSNADLVDDFSPNICTSDWSCQVGRYVIINQTRWEDGSPAWNQAGGSLRDYRHMVINHETGHRLGHDHLYTCGDGGKAPVMMQQSIDLRGCSFNPWPLDSELWRS